MWFANRRIYSQHLPMRHLFQCDTQQFNLHCTSIFKCLNSTIIEFWTSQINTVINWISVLNGKRLVFTILNVPAVWCHSIVFYEWEKDPWNWIIKLQDNKVHIIAYCWILRVSRCHCIEIRSASLDVSNGFLLERIKWHKVTRDTSTSCENQWSIVIETAWHITNLYQMFDFLSLNIK